MNKDTTEIEEKLNDPGCTRTLVRQTFSPKIATYNNEITTLRGFGGDKFVSTRKIYVVIMIDDVRFDTNMVAVNDELISENVLLGKDVLRSLSKRLIKRNIVCRVEQISNINNLQDFMKTKNYITNY